MIMLGRAPLSRISQVELPCTVTRDPYPTYFQTMRCPAGLILSGIINQTVQ
jgi:hypothetical protein